MTRKEISHILLKFNLFHHSTALTLFTKSIVMNEFLIKTICILQLLLVRLGFIFVYWKNIQYTCGSKLNSVNVDTKALQNSNYRGFFTKRTRILKMTRIITIYYCS